MVLCSSIVLSGCSFAFVSGPPQNHQQLPYFNCTEGRLWPILDGVFTAIQALRLAADLSYTEQEYEDLGGPWGRNADIGIAIGLGALGAAGMYYGFTKSGECRAARQQLLMRGAGGMQMQPGTWPPPGPAPMPAPAPVPAPAPGPTPAPDPAHSGPTAPPPTPQP
jgi:hypothetical protein